MGRGDVAKVVGRGEAPGQHGASRQPAPHGHALLERMLPDIAARARHGYIVEIGTTREKLPGQGSTTLLAGLAAELKLPFITVDMDPANTEQARRDLAGTYGAEAVTARGEDFLAQFRRPILAAYLDAFDIQHGQHSEYRVERYRRFLGTEITDAGAAAMHLACAQALIPRVVPGGVVVIDDTWTEGGRYAGKGRDAVPALLANGFWIAQRTRTAVALQRDTAVGHVLRRVGHGARGARRAAGRMARRVTRPFAP